MKTSGRRLAAAFAAAWFLLFPSAADAAGWEFHTYGGFVPVTDALRHVALVFSDPGYQGIFFSIAVLGMVVLWIGAMLKAAQAGKAGGLAAGWGIWTLLGLGLYLAFVLPKSDVMVYDAVKNRQEVVSGVPKGLAAILGTLNLVERAIVETIDAAGFVPPGMEYSSQAGGVGFDLLLGLGRDRVVLDDVHVRASLSRYVQNCFEWGVNNAGLAESGRHISINDVIRSPDLMDLLAKADYPGISTLYYDDRHPAGETTYCRDSWARLRAIMSSRAVWDAPLRSLCARHGFDPSVPAEFSRCRGAVQGGTAFVAGGTGMAAENLVRQVFLAGVVDWVVQKYSPDDAIRALASKDIGMKMTSAFVAASQWLPVMRTTITAVVIALTPALALLIPTGLAPRAAGMLFGFFFWITAWGIGDAITHSLAVQSAAHAFEEVRRWGLGYRSIMFFETDALKAMTMFAKMRVMSAVLATVTTMAVLRFGGHAMAMFAGSISGDVFAGAGRADDAVTPEGAAGMRGRAAESAGKLTAWDGTAKEGGIPEELTRSDPETSFYYRARAAEYGEGERLGYAGERIGVAGGDTAAAAERDAAARAKSAEKGVGESRELTYEDAYEIGRTAAAGAMANRDLLRKIADKDFGGDIMAAARAARGSSFAVTSEGKFGNADVKGKVDYTFDENLNLVRRKFDGIANSAQLKQMAKWQQSLGHDDTAALMKKTAEELLPGETARIYVEDDAHGGPAVFRAEHTAVAEHLDVGQRRDMSQNITGEEIISKGAVKWENATQRALDGDEKLYDPVTRSEGDARNARMWSLAAEIAAGMVSELKGVDYDQAKAALGLEAWGLGGGVESGTRSTEEVHSRVVELHDAMEQAYAEAAGQGLTPDDTNRFVAEEIQNYLNDIYKEAEGQNFGPNDYLSDAMDYLPGGGKGPEYKPPEDLGEITDAMD